MASAHRPAPSACNRGPRHDVPDMESPEPAGWLARCRDVLDRRCPETGSQPPPSSEPAVGCGRVRCRSSASVSSSAYQIEGSTRFDGRGDSIWDTFCRRAGTIDDAAPGAVAATTAAVAIGSGSAAAAGHRSYRFSIAWPRVMPTGRGRSAWAGSSQSNSWTVCRSGRSRRRHLVPLGSAPALQDGGGSGNRDCAGWFADYAAVLFDALDGGDLAHHRTSPRSSCSRLPAGMDGAQFFPTTSRPAGQSTTWVWRTAWLSRLCVDQGVQERSACRRSSPRLSGRRRRRPAGADPRHLGTLSSRPDLRGQYPSGMDELDADVLRGLEAAHGPTT